MRKLAIFLRVTVWLGLCAAGQASAQDPSVISSPGSNRSEREKEASIIRGADVLSRIDDLDRCHTMIAGDLISIRVLEDRHPACACRISSSGEIIVPYLGSIKATGLTPKELALKLKARLEEKKIFLDAHVMVSLDRLAQTISYHERFPSEKIEFVVVRGAVAKEGIYDITRQDATVSSLLLQAGGHTSQQKAPKILIYRKTPQGNKRILVNTRASLNEKRSDYDIFLRGDDVILVE